MSDVTREQVLTILGQVADPQKGTDVVASGMATAVQVKDGHVQVTLEVDPARGATAEPVRKAVEAAVAGMPGVLSATAVLTAERPAAQAQPRAAAAGGGSGGDNAPLLPGVRAIVAVASGKGGVGKSTTAANLAIACAASLFQVVLLNRSLRAFADHMPDGGGAILAGMPAMLVSNMLLTVSARSIDGAEAAVEHGARS